MQLFIYFTIGFSFHVCHMTGINKKVNSLADELLE